MLPELGGNQEELTELSGEPSKNKTELLYQEILSGLEKIKDLKKKIVFFENILGCTYEEFQEKKLNDPTVYALTTMIEKLQIENEKLVNALNLHVQSENAAYQRELHNRNHPFGGPEVKW